MRNFQVDIQSTVRLIYPKIMLLDHELNYEKKSEFTEEIINEINMLKGKVKTFNSLLEIINKKFGTDFNLNQMKYQVNKLLQDNFGKPEDDAYSFVELAKKEAEDDEFFNFEINKENQFYRVIFLSKTMLIYAEHFLDVIMVDATYKRNRFNLPLVNVLGINNYGQNIMLAFGLLSNETIDSYTWFFSKLQEAWGNKIPSNFIIGGCEAMKQGK